jgi:predicted phosphodiesterase
MNRGIIGLLADTHSNNVLLKKAIDKLRELGAEKIIHLGDICDSLMPQALDEAVQIMKDNHVRAVIGNNDYIVIADNLTDGLSDETVSYMKALPYTITSGDITFTHSSPFEWPAATRRPINEFIPSLHPEKHRLIFRGHSHTPSIVEIKNRAAHKIKIPDSKMVEIGKDSPYIITVGAVENNSIAIFDAQNLIIRFLMV